MGSAGVAAWPHPAGAWAASQLHVPGDRPPHEGNRYCYRRVHAVPDGRRP